MENGDHVATFNPGTNSIGGNKTLESESFEVYRQYYTETICDVETCLFYIPLFLVLIFQLCVILAAGPPVVIMSLDCADQGMNPVYATVVYSGGLVPNQSGGRKGVTW